MTFQPRASAQYFRYLVIVFFGIQLLSVWRIWQHTSDVATIFGRFSTGYGIVAIATVAGIAIWAWGIWQAKRIHHVVGKLPLRLRQAGIIALSIITLVMWSQLRIEDQLLAHLTLTIICLQGVLIATLPTSKETTLGRWWWVALVGIGLLLLIPFSISALGGREYSPDEALWADFAVAHLVDGKVYQRVLYGETWVILPGLGWFAAVYATLLDTFGIDIRVGRTIGIFFDLATYGMIFVIARHLYQWRVAVVSTLLAILGSTFVPFLDYRPDQYNAVFFLLTFFAILKAWHPDTKYRLLWSFLSGLVPTLAMQVHANAITMSVTVVTFHTGAWLWTRFVPARRTPDDTKRFIAMIIGAGIGTGLYFVLNILPVGGISIFLNNLIDERTTNIDGLSIRYLSEWSILELGLCGLALIALWHRHKVQDQRVLVFMSIFVVCITLLDTQHYIVAYRGLFYVFMGFGLAYMAQILCSAHSVIHLQWVGSIVSIAFFASFTLSFATSGIVQNTLRTGQLPDHRIHDVADDIASRLTPDELVISTHELIWGVGKRDNFYTEAAQVHRSRIWGISPSEVWERIQPDTVVYIEGRMPLPEELADYIAKTMTACEQFPSYGYPVTFYRVDCG